MSVIDVEGLEGKRILVVDDQEFIRNVLRSAFSNIPGMRVNHAVDGGEAIANLRVRDVDAIFLDIDMRPVNGLVALKAIRMGMKGVRRDVPVILLTNIDESEAVRAAVQLDVNGFVLKPASRRDLIARLKRVLETEPAIKSARDYARVTLPERLADVEVKEGDKQSDLLSKIARRERHEVVKIEITDLGANDLLMEDIVTDTGTALMSAGTIITESMLDQLIDLKSMITSPSIKVRRDVEFNLWAELDQQNNAAG